jgi:gamma-glutamyl phosphate reductase
MSRMRAGKWGILVASVIRKAPERLHEPLTQILLSMDNLPYDELHHLRRLIEVNIPRGEEKYIQQCEDGARKLLKKHPKKNIDCVCIIDALDHVVDLIQISEERKLLEDEKKEDENKRETTH